MRKGRAVLLPSWRVAAPLHQWLSIAGEKGSTRSWLGCPRQDEAPPDRRSIPLARAQDAVERLEAAVAAARS